MKITIVILLSFVLTSNAIDVKVCSEPNFEGSCATKDYDSRKCEHLPWRFRWIYNVRSVQIKPSFFGGCNAQCELHTKENCGHSLLSMVLSQNSQAMPFDCEKPILSVIPGMTFRGVVCYRRGIFG